MKRQGGFTLIELVVVIVILGILAVTAAPKFLNLQGDARASSLQGLKGAMSGAAGIVYGKAAIEGKEGSTVAVDIDDISTKYGYPVAATGGIDEAVIGLSDDWAQLSPAVATKATYYFKGATAPASGSVTPGCYVTYTEATTASSGISVIVEDKGC